MTFSAMNRLLDVTGYIGYRMKDRNKNRKTEFRLVGLGLSTKALDKKWGFSFSSTTSLKSKVDISSRNLLHQVDYRGRWESFLPGYLIFICVNYSTSIIMNFKTWKGFCDTKPIYNELDAKLVFWISGSALLVTGFRNLFLPCFDYNFLQLQEILLWVKNHIIV